MKVYQVAVPTDTNADDAVVTDLSSSYTGEFGTGYHKFFPDWWGQLRTNSILYNKMVYALQATGENQVIDYYKQPKVMIYNLDTEATLNNRRRYTKVLSAMDMALPSWHCTDSNNAYYVRFKDGIVDSTKVQFCTGYNTTTGVCDTNVANTGTVSEWLDWTEGTVYPNSVGGSCEVDHLWTDDLTVYEERGVQTQDRNIFDGGICPESPHEPDMNWSPNQSGNPTEHCHDYNLTSGGLDFKNFKVRLETANSQANAILMPAKIGTSSIANGLLRVTLDDSKARGNNYESGIVTGESLIECTGYTFHEMKNFYLTADSVYIVDFDEAKTTDQISILKFSYDGSTCAYQKTVANELLNGVLDLYAQ